MRSVGYTILALVFFSLPLSASIKIVSDFHGDSAYADSIIRITGDRLYELIGISSPDSLTVFIVATEDKFDSLAGDAVPDWGAGVAIPIRRLIIIKSPLILPGDKSLGELVAHEYTHVVLAQAVAFRPVPRWLNEGMSMYVSAEWGWGDNLSISWAVVLGSVIPLQEIERLNRFDGGQAGVAYSESYLAFKYFVDTYGISSLNILLNTIKAGRSHDYAFVAATGIDQADFEREFAAVLNGRYNLLTLIFNSNLLWILLALLIVVGFILNRIKRKGRMEQFDEYDKLHSTDFDYGNVEEPDEDKPWD